MGDLRACVLLCVLSLLCGAFASSAPAEGLAAQGTKPIWVPVWENTKNKILLNDWKQSVLHASQREKFPVRRISDSGVNACRGCTGGVQECLGASTGVEVMESAAEPSLLGCLAWGQVQRCPYFCHQLVSL